MKIVRWAGIGIAIIILGLQFIRPERTNPPIDETRTFFSQMSAPDDIKAMIERSCSDCHSHATRWPWYSNIAPISWLVADDVEEARKHLNLSDFAQYRSLRAVGKLDMMCENMQDGSMPQRKYLIMHPNAKLSSEEINRFCDWVDSVRDRVATQQ